MRCWCGKDASTPFCDGYHRCDACQTLVSDDGPHWNVGRVTNDSADYYGRRYWFEHQTGELACPDIVSRSRTDLSERCLHWLRTLLQFKLPPAKVLEIGCGHGGFVAMLRQAGYDVQGLELSPSIVEFAQETFDVPVLTGPIEDQNLPSGAFDAIVLMDVMEHLPQPLRTLGKCLQLLKPDGILLVQTPEYPEDKTLGQLQGVGHKFPMMLDADEHLYLYSERSARKLFEQLGARHITFTPAIFDFYDMSFVVSRQTIRETTMKEQEVALSQTINGRLLQAMLDLDDRRLSLLGKYRNLHRQAQRLTGRCAS